MEETGFSAGFFIVESVVVLSFISNMLHRCIAVLVDLLCRHLYMYVHVRSSL